jgi:hypothetical protein
MLKKVVASGIAVVAIVGLVTGPASARHKHHKHGQTTGMSASTPNGGPTVSHGGGAGPSGQAGGAAGGNAGANGAAGK